MCAENLKSKIDTQTKKGKKEWREREAVKGRPNSNMKRLGASKQARQNRLDAYNMECCDLSRFASSKSTVYY